MSSSIKAVLKPHQRDIGNLYVRRVLPALAARLVGPFIFFDHMGPATLAPGSGVDVRPHPHIGLATVTYLFDGALMHRDSIGSSQKIVPGDVNWMTAGRGIVHSERTPVEDRATGLTMHGIQTWVALPRASELAEPEFHHHAEATLPRVSEPGVELRVVAGTAFGERSPVAVFSPTLYVAARMQAGGAFELDAGHEERGVYVAEGDVAVAGARVPPQHLAVLASGERVEVRAATAARVMLLGGAKTDGERFIWWNFVASTRERIEEAKQLWRDQRFPRIPGETEFVSLPAK